MRAIELTRPGQFQPRQLADPGPPPAGWARVRVRRVGICGTDWHAYAGRQPFFSYPRVLGHELGVEVEDSADGSLQRGDRCAVEPYLNCGTCGACRSGKSNCCESLQVLGVHVDGGMCESLWVPVAKLHRSTKLALEQLALVETLAIGCHAVNRAGVSPGDRVLVLGAGPIGLSILPFLKAAGAEVCVADISESRLAFCRDKMGVSRTLDARRDLAEQLDTPPVIVMDATGNPSSMTRTFDWVAHGGTIVFVGLFPGDVTFHDPNFHRREVTLKASRNALPADFRRIIAMIENGEVDTTPWITHRAELLQLPDVAAQWARPETGVIKAMLTCDA